MNNPQALKFRDQCLDQTMEIRALLESFESEFFETEVYERALRKLKMVKDSLEQEKALRKHHRADILNAIKKETNAKDC